MHFLSKIGDLCHAKIANEGDMWSNIIQNYQKLQWALLGQPLKTIKNYYNEQDLFTN